MDNFEQIKRIEDRLPRGVRAFALDPDYWDPTCHRCPHDAWVESLNIREELAPKDDPFPLWLQNRAIHIQLRLLGWSHKNMLDYHYRNVTSYAFKMPALCRHGNSAHGDWLEDSFDVGESGGVVHKIQFSGDSIWRIECGDIVLCDIPI